VIAPARSGSAGQDLISHSSGPLRAEAGDTLIVDGDGLGGLPRIGTIVAVSDPAGSPPFLVRWLAGDYESRISPGLGARVQRHA
jgi:hypothetical protein